MLKSTIVLSNSIDESEKIKSLASFNESTFDLRYMSALELAEYLLQLSGISYKEEFVKNDELAARIYLGVKDIPYFNLFTYNDVLGLVSTLEDLRYQIVQKEDETFFEQLPTDKFQAKNSALKNAYELLKKCLKENNLIDEVDIVRFALENIKPQKDIEFKIFEKNHLRPLELALVNKAAGKEVKPLPINEELKKLKIERYTKAFGQTNEIEDILAYIYEKNIPFDQCLIASAEEANYANILSNYRDLLKAPITIGTGKLVTSTGPGKLFALLDDWKQSLYRYEYLLKIVQSEFFNAEQFKKDINLPEDLTSLNALLDRKHQMSLDVIAEIVGRLKISFDEQEKNLQKYQDYEDLVKRYQSEKYHEEETKLRVMTLGHVLKFIEIINNGISNFMERYSIIKDEKLDGSALGKILKMFSFVNDFGVPYENAREQLYGQNIAREKPQPGTLYFTSISRASSCLRKYLFITGLSSNNYPGSSKENPLLLDRDYEQFGVDEASNREIKNNIDTFDFLLEEAMKYDVEVHLSWASYNSESLKAQNASSVVFKTYKDENGDEKTLADFNNKFPSKKYRYIEFFNKDVLPITPIGKMVNENKQNNHIVLETQPNEALEVEALKNKAFSASAVKTYAECEYRLYLQTVLGIEQDQEVDIYEIIPANEYGTMAHDLLEHFDKNRTSEQDFLKQAENRFNEYLIFNPFDNQAMVNSLRLKFIKMMQNAYEMESTKPTYLAEKDVYCIEPTTGIKIHGLPDKVLDNRDGTYSVIDYKTGYALKHFVDNVPSMIQCTIYSYVLKNAYHLNITSFEYRYLRNKARVFSTDKGYTMDDHFNNLINVLARLKESIETGSFKDTNDKDICKHCYLKDACTKKK